MNPVICVCSRKESSRVPSKAFFYIVNKPTIKHIENRLAGMDIDTVFLVPPAQVAEYKNYLSGNVIGGNPDSPLHRISDYLFDNPQYTHVVRVTGDDIIIDTRTIKEMLSCVERRGYGYVNCPSIIEGAGVEVICRENLLHAAEMRTIPTEFISYFVRGKGLPNPKQFKYTPRKAITRDYRLTFDYPEDGILLEAVLRELGADASCDSICKFLDNRPELLKINKLPRYTLYTCAYNASEWIGKTIKSILACHSDFEYVIVDDCSADGTLTEIMKSVNGDKRVKIILNSVNRGLASSSNVAINHARGEYVMRVDADDIVLPHHFDMWLESAILEDRDAVYPAYYEMREDGSITNTIVNGRLNNHAGCCMMRKRFINELRFKEGIRHWDGHELYLRLRERATIGYYHLPIWAYRLRQDSMSRTDSKTRAKLKAEIESAHIKVKKASR